MLKLLIGIGVYRGDRVANPGPATSMKTSSIALRVADFLKEYPPFE